MSIVSSNDLGKEICDAFGLKYIRKIIITLEKGSMVRLETESFMKTEDSEKLISILKKYELKEIE